MGLEQATNAVRALVKVIDVARDMRTARATGSVLEEVLRDAEELLEIVERELEGLDRNRHSTLFAAAPLLRRRLERLDPQSSNTAPSRAGVTR